MKKAISIIAIILVILLLFGGFMLIRKLSNNFTDDVKTFYVEIDGETITGNKTNMTLLGKRIAVYSISTDRSFTYKIVPKASKNFKFTANGTERAFTDKSDYTSAFAVTTTDSSVEIAATGLQDVLNNTYETNVVLPYLNTQTCYFTLIIGNADGSKTISLDFYVEVINLTHTEGIQLDITHIVF